MLRTFRIGGIHPPENKLSAGKKITGLAIPKQVIIIRSGKTSRGTLLSRN